MSIPIGPVLYLSGIPVVLLASALAVNFGNLWLALLGGYLMALGVTALMSGLWPAKKFRPDRRDYREALFIVAIALMLNELLFGPFATHLSGLLSAYFLPSPYVEMVRALPFWVALPVALVLYEGIGYLLHRISHAWSPLWQRVHSVHHEVEHFGVPLSFRLSYAEFFLHQMTRLLLVQLTQIDSAVIVTVIALATYGVFVSHANTSLRFGRMSRYLNTPDFHVWHHDPTLRVNYSIGLLSVFDRLGGTQHDSDSVPDRLGIDGLAQRRSVLETVMLRPLHEASDDCSREYERPA